MRFWSWLQCLGCKGLFSGMNAREKLQPSLAKAYGAATIIVTDLELLRLEAAKKMGATHVINALEQDAVAAIKEITGGKGGDSAEHPFYSDNEVGIYGIFRYANTDPKG